MPGPSHARAVWLVLALSVVVGGWLFLDYGSRPSTQNVPAQVDGRTAGADSNQPEPSTEAAPNSPPIDQRIFPADMAVTFKCEKGGHVSFGDKPCGSNEKTVAVTAVQRERPAEQKSNLEQMKERAVAMEAARHARDRQFDLEAAAIATNAVSTNPNKTMRCEQIDKSIAGCDSVLRRPHSAPEGDYWTGERKKLTDERFSIGC